jgi:hypothetical protein
MTPDMTCNDLAGGIIVLTVALDRQHPELEPARTRGTA